MNTKPDNGIQELLSSLNASLDTLLEVNSDKDLSKCNDLNHELVGNWFLYKDRHDDLFITKDVPTMSDTTAYLESSNLSGWMCLTMSGKIANDTFYKGQWTLTPQDFMNLRLPEMEKNTILEIEITPSGKVYFY